MILLSPAVPSLASGVPSGVAFGMPSGDAFNVGASPGVEARAEGLERAHMRIQHRK